MEKNTIEQQIQEDEYCFPYHYSDLFIDEHRFLNSLEYIGLLKKIKKIVLKLNINELIDIGCGDGRLIFELKSHIDSLYGIDYSEKAIRFAQVFNPDSVFLNNISELTPDRRFDLITNINVLEHIPDDQIKKFLKDIDNILSEKGKLLIAVPSLNLKLSSKHFIHYSIESITECLEEFFEIEELYGQDFHGINYFIFQVLRKIGYLLYQFRYRFSFVDRFLNIVRNFYLKKVSEGTEIHKANVIIIVCRKK